MSGNATCAPENNHEDNNDTVSNAPADFTIVYAQDLDEDGEFDTFGLDTTGDGMADVRVRDSDDDDEANFTHYTTGEGYDSISEYDHDGDGEPDTVTRDVDAQEPTEEQSAAAETPLDTLREMADDAGFVPGEIEFLHDIENLADDATSAASEAVDEVATDLGDMADTMSELIGASIDDFNLNDISASPEPETETTAVDETADETAEETDSDGPIQVGTIDESKIVASHDLDVDGVDDTFSIDLDGDGKVDTLAYDTDGDGNIDRMYTDLDGDGVAEQEHADTDGDGVADTVYTDTDGDGVFDRIDQDTDGDGMTDAYAGVYTDDEAEGMEVDPTE